MSQTRSVFVIEPFLQLSDGTVKLLDNSFWSTLHGHVGGLPVQSRAFGWGAGTRIRGTAKTFAGESYFYLVRTRSSTDTPHVWSDDEEELTVSTDGQPLTEPMYIRPAGNTGLALCTKTAMAPSWSGLASWLNRVAPSVDGAEYAVRHFVRSDTLAVLRAAEAVSRMSFRLAPDSDLSQVTGSQIKKAVESLRETAPTGFIDVGISYGRARADYEGSQKMLDEVTKLVSNVDVVRGEARVLDDNGEATVLDFVKDRLHTKIRLPNEQGTIPGVYDIMNLLDAAEEEFGDDLSRGNMDGVPG